MHDLSIHLIPFLEVVAALVATPIVGVYVWRGIQRRKRARLAHSNTGQTPALPPESSKR